MICQKSGMNWKYSQKTSMTRKDSTVSSRKDGHSQIIRRYHRIISRLGKHSRKVHAGKAKRLLGWIACSLIPLTIEEAQQALAVEPGNPKQTYSIFAKLDPVELLGPIVETAGGYIRFVHFTAKE